MRALWTGVAVVTAFGLAIQIAGAGEPSQAKLVFSCAPTNDLYRVLTKTSGTWKRYDSPGQAVAEASEGSGVLILADGYPTKTTAIAPSVYRQAAAKKLRLYVEFPSALPGVKCEEPRSTLWERAVVSSDFFGPTLKKLRILGIHDCHFVPTPASDAHIVVARVAGFDTAVYGLGKQVFPILFEHSGGGLLVATTKLSQFATARYAPSEAWRLIWQKILGWCAPGSTVPALAWTPTVRPSYGRSEKLPADVEAAALRRGAQWFVDAKLVVSPSRMTEIKKLDKAGKYLGPTPGPDVPVGDGTLGILEGYNSQIFFDGSQEQRIIHRGDCNCESAMGLAFGGTIGEKPGMQKVASNILDYWFFRSAAQQGVRADPKHPAFGLVSWGVTNWAWEKAFYGDDNARVLLGTMAAAALLQTDQWDEAMLKCLLANLRTTGRLGFRRNRIDLPDLSKNGWRYYFNASTISYAPHYQAHLWACYLWAYRHTGHELFLQRTKNAIRMTMNAYPNKWRWTNGIAQERARLLLPLAWLVRLEDTAEHRRWLRRIAKDLLALQDASGAIREELGPPGRGSYGPPRSNAEYGKHEATLMQANGDPLCDLLYTTNFAFIGLREAAAATGEALFVEAENKLATFLCRIQIRSETHPELDGGWFRAFDFNRWEYWASNADLGWGAWSIESGWTQGWIVAVLGLRDMKTSLWDLTAKTRIKRHLAKLRPMMLPEDDAGGSSRGVKHAAVGKKVKLATGYAPEYVGGGADGLVDGLMGIADHRDPSWQGYHAVDLDAVIDLGKTVAVRTIRSHYLQSVRVGVFLPSRVECAVSEDGKTFRVVGQVVNETPAKWKGPFSKWFEVSPKNAKGRYVRVRAKNVGVVPDWHEAKGRKAWLFVDEIAVNPGGRDERAMNVRRPTTDADLKFWLENMLWYHRFTPAEVTAATGLLKSEITDAVKEFNITPGNKPKRSAGEPLRVLPYPGGRHPRIGFLDGAIRPQRETKISVFTPWDENSYVVVDVPEAIWSNLGLTYLAHTHVPTLWTKNGIELDRLEWTRQPDGTLECKRTLPNSIGFGTRIMPSAEAVRMEMWLTNGTVQTLTGLRVQNCVMTKAAAGFEQRTNDNKVLAKPYAACRSTDGKRWIITAWEHCDRPWANDKCPCFHSDPKFPDCPPGQTKRLRGWLSFYEGEEIQGEFRRIEKTGWRSEAK